MMRRVVWSCSILLIILGAAPLDSWGHAYLVKSSPARRAVLSTPPTRVILWFNERLEAQFSQLSIWNAEGQQVDEQDIEVGPDDSKRLAVGIPTLPPGSYTVKYRVLSVDGHVVEAEFPFTIRSR
jgi:methionine-rich copper-binding protein CopC